VRQAHKAERPGPGKSEGPVVCTPVPKVALGARESEPPVRERSCPTNAALRSLTVAAPMVETRHTLSFGQNEERTFLLRCDRLLFLW
jgi:hypothetical protein